jgi:hypothetical protein
MSAALVELTGVSVVFDGGCARSRCHARHRQGEIVGLVGRVRVRQEHPMPSSSWD